MTVYRLQSLLRRSSPLSKPTQNTTLASITATFTHSFAYSSAEEAANRVVKPSTTLLATPSAPSPCPDPNAPRLPDPLLYSLVLVLVFTIESIYKLWLSRVSWGTKITLPFLILRSLDDSICIVPCPDVTMKMEGPEIAGNLVVALRISGNPCKICARHAVFSNNRPTVFTCNAIMASMYRATWYKEVISLFQFFFNQSNIVPNIVSYNVLINTHCDAGRVDVVLDVYAHILANAPFGPPSATYRHLTKGLVEADRISDAMNLFREMLNKGHGTDSLVYNNLISGFLELGNLERANELFDELRERCLDGTVNATYMEWFFKKGMRQRAMLNTWISIW
ncbi:hypothetical protein IFM89_003521 [Coptis chinensis]|uniref:Pentatricopeptide repeat-containing protein n=1 Tax=Coptis chinensis TaxID=261450 RepID=A0A835GYF9_9MAGN|nr:hypothetical protein IFM89_003521 [Coptis chinensis]